MFNALYANYSLLSQKNFTQMVSQFVKLVKEPKGYIVVAIYK